MDENTTHGPSLLGVPTLVESDVSTLTYPHRITQFASRLFQRTCIEVRIGPPEVDINNPTHGDYVQHPAPFDADGSLSMGCRRLLMECVRETVKHCRLRMCMVWTSASCSYVETDGTICETAAGVASPARIAFEAARAVLCNQYPQIDIEDPAGTTKAACPTNATNEELVAQAVAIVMRTGRRARVMPSEAERFYAELTDRFDGPLSPIRPCVVWSESLRTDDSPTNADCDTELSMRSPHIAVYGRHTFFLFYPDTLIKEELIAKGTEIVAKWFPRVCVVWSSTESAWPRPPLSGLH